MALDVHEESYVFRRYFYLRHGCEEMHKIAVASLRHTIKVDLVIEVNRNSG